MQDDCSCKLLFVFFSYINRMWDSETSWRPPGNHQYSLVSCEWLLMVVVAVAAKPSATPKSSRPKDWSVNPNYGHLAKKMCIP